MTPQLINGFWTSTDHRIGPWHVAGGTVTQEQKDNANAIKSFLVDEVGWTLNAVCAILGNMMGESTLNPGFIQQTNRYRLPNDAQDLSDVPNNVMANFYSQYYGSSSGGYGIGLVQWDGYTASAGVNRQKLVNYAIVNNFEWYDGWTQCYRLRFEWQKDPQYHFFKKQTIGGVVYDFDTFVHSTASISDLTKAWSYGYERNAGGAGERINDAQYWWNYFDGGSVTPVQPDDPGQADPDEPYDPDHPVSPDESPIDDFLATLLLFIGNKRKELKPRCLRI